MWCGDPTRTRTRTHFTSPPRLRELWDASRDGRGAHLPSPRWRARHGQPVASSFRHACLRSAPPCIIRKRVASEAAASSRATVSLADRMHSTALMRCRCHPSLRIAPTARSSPPATPHAQLWRWDSAALALSAFFPCAGPTHLSEPPVEHTCLCCPRAARRRPARSDAQRPSMLPIRFTFISRLID